MEEEVKQTEIRLGDLWTILKRCWILMLAAFIVVSLGVFIFLNNTHQDEYTASVSIWALRNVGTENGSGTSTADVSIANYLVNDYKALITTDAVVDRVINAQALSVKPQQLRKMVTVTHENDTRILTISVTTASPASAKELADSWATEFCTYINDDKMNGEQMVTMVGEARLPEIPSNPISLLKILLIGFVCAVLIYGVYFLLFILDDKINTAEDVEKYLGLSVLGTIPNKHAFRRRSNGNGYYYSSSRANAQNKQKL